MKKITADVIFDGNGNMLSDTVIIYDASKGVLDLLPVSQFDLTELAVYKGAVGPGWINSHCHIELSHLKGVIPSGTGLISFIEKIVTLRNYPEEVVFDKISEAITEMNKTGITAVGDICNTADTMNAKMKSSMRFYNFIECFDLFQKNIEEQWSNYKNVWQNFSTKENIDQKNLVPHAPYSVSRKLYQHISEVQQPGQTTSIHNQETPDENKFSNAGEGQLREFYNKLGLDLSGYLPIRKKSVNAAIDHIRKDQKLLLVHNTMSDADDIGAVIDSGHQAYWCTCPNANLYIENTLPDYNLWRKNDLTICIGTDSLASNWQLDILEEIKTIQKFNSSIPLKELVQWATLNGAQALGFDQELGSIEVGKNPGLVQFDLDQSGSKVDQNARSLKIA